MADSNTSLCAHEHAELVPSYYSDTQWCPDCGAVRGTDGKFGPDSRMLEWQLPKREAPKLELPENAPADNQAIRTPMSEAEITARIDEIRASVGDLESAHCLEDELRRDFLRAIAADGRLGEVARLARLVLSTEQIEFPRWCA